MNNKFGASFLAVIFALTASVKAADTTESTWSGGTSNNWSVSTNWSNGVPSATVSAEFNGSFSNQPNLTAAAGSTAQGIWVTGSGNTGVAGLTTISATTGTLTIVGTATLDGVPNAGILLDGSGNNNLTITAPVAVSNSTSFDVNNAGTLTISGALNLSGISTGTLTLGGSNAAGNIDIGGAISGSGANLLVSTSGTVTLTGVNTYTGTSTSPTSGGATTINSGATLEIAGAGSLKNGNALTDNGTFIYNSSAAQTLLTNGTSVLSGSGSFYQNGPGTLTFSGQYSAFTGTFYLNGGILNLNYNGGALNAVTFGGGTLQYSSNNTADNSAKIINSTGAIAIDTNGQNVTFASALAASNTGGLTKIGSGTLTLTAAEAYTGATTVNGGTLFINAELGGSLQSSTPLVMGGGTFLLQGSVGSPYNQTVASLATTAGTTSQITVNPDSPSVTTLTVTSNTLSNGAGSYLNFNYTGGTTNGATVGNNYVAWNPTLTNGIIGGGYTVSDIGGTGFATVNGGDVVRLTDNAPGSSGGLPTSGGSTSGNYFIDSSYSTTSTTTPGSLVEALSGNVTANTLTVNTTGLSSGATLSLNSYQLSFTAGSGIVFNGPNPYSITASSGGGITSATSGGALVFYNYATSPVTISAPILANGTNAVTFTGPGTTILSGSNSYTGATSISSGIVNYQNGTAFGTNSAITTASGATIQVQGGIAGGSQTLTISGTGATGATGALENVSGSNSYAGAVVLGSSGTTISSDAGTLTLNGPIYGTSTGDGLVLTGAGNGTVVGVINGGTSTTAGAGTLTMNGTGTWTLTGANTYTGRTTVSSGTLQVGNGTSGKISGSSALTVSGGTFDLVGLATGNTSQSVNGLTATGGTSSIIELTPNGTGTTTLSIGATPSVGAASVLNFNYDPNGSGTTNGSMLGNAYVIGGGSLTLTNSLISAGWTVTDAGGTGYATVVSGDVVRYVPQNPLPTNTGTSTGNYGVNSTYSASNGLTGAGGQEEVLTGNVAANTVTVDTTGQASGATLSLGTHTLTLTSGGGMLFGGPNPYSITASSGGGLTSSTTTGTITLSNYSTGTVTISAPILSSTGPVNFVGTGTTVLSGGGNASTAATTVIGGTLAVNSTLDGAVNIGNNGTILVGAGMTANFAGTTAATEFDFNGTNGTLSVTGGGVADFGGTIASSSSTAGNVINVSGSGSTINMASLNTPFFYGVLTANIINGGTWNITGSGSGTLVFGRSGGSGTNLGTLNIGTLDSTTDTATFNNPDANYGLQFGNSGGSGVLNMYSGTFTNAGSLALQESGSGTGTLNVYGGTFNQSGGLGIGGAATSGQTDAANFFGGTSTLGAVTLGNGGPTAGTSYSYFNVSGGTVTETGSFTFGLATASSGAGATDGLTVSSGTLTIEAGVNMGRANQNSPATSEYILVDGGLLALSGSTVTGTNGLSGDLAIAAYNGAYGSSQAYPSVNNLTVSSGTFTSAGNITIGGNYYNGTLIANSSVNTINFSGGVTSLTSGTSTPADFILINGTVNQTGTAAVTMDGLLMGSTATYNLNGGTLQVGQGNVASSGFTVHGGALTVLNNGQNAGPGTSGGTLTFTKGLTLESGSVTISNSSSEIALNTGTTTGTGTLTMSGGTLTADGEINGNVSASGGLLTGNSSGYITGNVLLSGTGTIDFTSAAFNIGGTLGITGGTTAWTGSGYVSGLTTLSGGTFTVGSGAVLEADDGFNITGGSIAAGGSSATIQLGGTLNYTSGSNSTFAGVIADDPNEGEVGALTMNSAGGAFTLTGANTYSAGTTVSAGALYVNNTSGSGTGSGAVQVNSGGTLAGSGKISGAVTLNTTTSTPATLSSGKVQTSYATSNNGNGMVNGTGTGGGMTLSSTLLVKGGSTLSFALGSSTSSGNGGYSVTNPDTDSTYLTVGGSSLIFADTTTMDNISLTDLTAPPAGSTQTTYPTLTLRYQGAYLLIAAAAADFTNLYTTGAGNSGNGYVLGVDNGSGGYTAFNIEMFNSLGAQINTATNYEHLQLYLNNGDLEVVPEPSTWALILGGLAFLLFWGRRKSKLT